MSKTGRKSTGNTVICDTAVYEPGVREHEGRCQGT